MMHQMQALAQKQVNPYIQNITYISNSTSIARIPMLNQESLFHSLFLSRLFIFQTENKKTILHLFVIRFLGQICGVCFV